MERKIIQIDRDTLNSLRAVGLIRETTRNDMRNYQITSRRKNSKGKTYYLVEEMPQLLFLGYFEQFVQDRKIKEISYYEFKELLRLHPNLKVQKRGDYIPQADMYVWEKDKNKTAYYVKSQPNFIRELYNMHRKNS